MSRLDPLPNTTRAPAERVAYLDNARYWVMLLVVIGHSLTEIIAMSSARGVYTWIYLFHMPFFILISGYTARHYVGDFRQVRRVVSTLVIPYLIVETSLQLLTMHYDGEPEHLRILSPQWIGWFLAALFIWRLTTPIWRALKYPITTSIVISLAAGLIDIPNVLALPKVLGFLPFYVIGLHFTRENFEKLADIRIRVASLVFLAVTFAAMMIYMSKAATPFAPQWLLWRVRYDADPLNVSLASGVFIRAGLIVLALTMTLAALSLIPWSKSWTTALGGRTFYAYLLHGYLILILNKQFGLWDEIEGYGALATLGCIAVAIVIANVLMLKFVATVFRPVFEPRLRGMFREPDEDDYHRGAARRDVWGDIVVPHRDQPFTGHGPRIH